MEIDYDLILECLIWASYKSVAIDILAEGRDNNALANLKFDRNEKIKLAFEMVKYLKENK